ncbi:MAG: hypothetical protein AAFZ87_04060 [Planctomycetota bacterium]
MTATVESRATLENRLYARFRAQSLPLLVSMAGTTPAASLWTGSRLWVQALRERGAESGSRLWVDLGPGPAVLQVLLAALWLDCDTVLGALPAEEPEDAVVRAGCSLAVADRDGPWVLRPDGVSGPHRVEDGVPRAGHSSAHAPWLLLREEADAAFRPTGALGPHATLELPALWTERAALLDLVLPALADGAALVEPAVLASPDLA